MAPKFPAITASKGNSLSRPHSAIRTPHGRKAASKTPSVASVDTSPEKPASTTCPPTPSTPSSQSTTILPENASASKPQPKSSYRYTSNVNPHRSEERRVGKECVVRVDHGGRRSIKKKKKNIKPM